MTFLHAVSGRHEPNAIYFEPTALAAGFVGRCFLIQSPTLAR